MPLAFLHTAPFKSNQLISSEMPVSVDSLFQQKRGIAFVVAWIRTVLLGIFHALSLCRRVNIIVQHDKMLSHSAKTTCTLCIFPIRDASVILEGKKGRGRERKQCRTVKSSPKRLCVFMFVSRWSITRQWWFVVVKCCNKFSPLLKLFFQKKQPQKQETRRLQTVSSSTADLTLRSATGEQLKEKPSFRSLLPAFLGDVSPTLQYQKLRVLFLFLIPGMKKCWITKVLNAFSIFQLYSQLRADFRLFCPGFFDFKNILNLK